MLTKTPTEHWVQWGCAGMWRVEKLTVTEESYSRVHEKHREWQKQSFNCFQISVFIHSKDLICIIMTSEPHTVFASPCFSHCPLVAVHSFNMNMYSFLHFCFCTDFHIWVMLHFLLWVALPLLQPPSALAYIWLCQRTFLLYLSIQSASYKNFSTLKCFLCNIYTYSQCDGYTREQLGVRQLVQGYFG